jgi:hypothetical protein
MSGATPDLSGVLNGIYTGAVSNAGPNDSYNLVGSASETIYTPPPPGFDGYVNLSNGGELAWNYTTTGGSCGFQGQDTYTQWNFSNLTYIESTSTYPLTGGGAYIDSPGQGQGCPPGGPQPPSGETVGPAGPNNVMITFTPGEYGQASATIQ